MLNALTIDVEDYFMVSAFSDTVHFRDWRRFESRVERNTYLLLELLERYGVKATFFVLGWVGEQFPHLVRDIHSAGHEVGSHGYNHRLVFDQSPEEFRSDVRRAKEILENITNQRVDGYRAASYSIVKKTLWALDELVDAGFVYDSSIFPIHHDRYGFPGADRLPHIITRGDRAIHEFPPSTYPFLGLNFPVAGGGYLRLLPCCALKSAIRQINRNEGRPFILYVHPWEIDVDQPRLKGKRLSMVRHYLNLSSTMPKLRSLLRDFSFGPLRALLNI